MGDGARIRQPLGSIRDSRASWCRGYGRSVPRSRHEAWSRSCDQSASRGVLSGQGAAGSIRSARPRSAASSARGLQFSGGRHLTTLAMSMSCLVSKPTASMTLSNIFPARPTKAMACLSSFSPGPSPIVHDLSGWVTSLCGDAPGIDRVSAVTPARGDGRSRPHGGGDLDERR